MTQSLSNQNLSGYRPSNVKRGAIVDFLSMGSNVASSATVDNYAAEIVNFEPGKGNEWNKRPGTKIILGTRLKLLDGDGNYVYDRNTAPDSSIMFYNESGLQVFHAKDGIIFDKNGEPQPWYEYKEIFNFNYQEEFTEETGTETGDYVRHFPTDTLYTPLETVNKSTTLETSSFVIWTLGKRILYIPKNGSWDGVIDNEVFTPFVDAQTGTPTIIDTVNKDQLFWLQVPAEVVDIYKYTLGQTNYLSKRPGYRTEVFSPLTDTDQYLSPANDGYGYTAANLYKGYHTIENITTTETFSHDWVNDKVPVMSAYQYTSSKPLEVYNVSKEMEIVKESINSKSSIKSIARKNNMDVEKLKELRENFNKVSGRYRQYPHFKTSLYSNTTDGVTNINLSINGKSKKISSSDVTNDSNVTVMNGDFIIENGLEKQQDMIDYMDENGIDIISNEDGSLQLSKIKINMGEYSKAYFAIDRNDILSDTLYIEKTNQVYAVFNKGLENEKRIVYDLVDSVLIPTNVKSDTININETPIFEPNNIKPQQQTTLFNGKFSGILYSLNGGVGMYSFDKKGRHALIDSSKVWQENFVAYSDNAISVVNPTNGIGTITTNSKFIVIDGGDYLHVYDGETLSNTIEPNYLSKNTIRYYGKILKETTVNGIIFAGNTLYTDSKNYNLDLITNYLEFKDGEINASLITNEEWDGTIDITKGLTVNDNIEPLNFDSVVEYISYDGKVVMHDGTKLIYVKEDFNEQGTFTSVWESILSINVSNTLNVLTTNDKFYHLNKETISTPSEFDVYQGTETPLIRDRLYLGFKIEDGVIVKNVPGNFISIRNDSVFICNVYDSELTKYKEISSYAGFVNNFERLEVTATAEESKSKVFELWPMKPFNGHNIATAGALGEETKDWKTWNGALYHAMNEGSIFDGRYEKRGTTEITYTEMPGNLITDNIRYNFSVKDGSSDEVVFKNWKKLFSTTIPSSFKYVDTRKDASGDIINHEFDIISVSGKSNDYYNIGKLEFNNKGGITTINIPVDSLPYEWEYHPSPIPYGMHNGLFEDSIYATSIEYPKMFGLYDINRKFGFQKDTNTQVNNDNLFLSVPSSDSKFITLFEQVSQDYDTVNNLLPDVNYTKHPNGIFDPAYYTAKSNYIGGFDLIYNDYGVVSSAESWDTNWLVDAEENVSGIYSVHSSIFDTIPTNRLYNINSISNLLGIADDMKRMTSINDFNKLFKGIDINDTVDNIISIIYDNIKPSDESIVTWTPQMLVTVNRGDVGLEIMGLDTHDGLVLNDTIGVNNVPYSGWSDNIDKLLSNEVPSTSLYSKNILSFPLSDKNNPLDIGSHKPALYVNLNSWNGNSFAWDLFPEEWKNIKDTKTYTTIEGGNQATQTEAAAFIAMLTLPSSRQDHYINQVDRIGITKNTHLVTNNKTIQDLTTVPDYESITIETTDIALIQASLKISNSITGEVYIDTGFKDATYSNESYTINFEEVIQWLTELDISGTSIDNNNITTELHLKGSLPGEDELSIINNSYINSVFVNILNMLENDALDMTDIYNVYKIVLNVLNKNTDGKSLISVDWRYLQKIKDSVKADTAETINGDNIMVKGLVTQFINNKVASIAASNEDIDSPLLRIVPAVQANSIGNTFDNTGLFNLESGVVSFQTILSSESINTSLYEIFRNIFDIDNLASGKGLFIKNSAGVYLDGFQQGVIYDKFITKQAGDSVLLVNITIPVESSIFVDTDGESSVWYENPDFDPTQDESDSNPRYINEIIYRSNGDLYISAESFSYITNYMTTKIISYADSVNVQDYDLSIQQNKNHQETNIVSTSTYDNKLVFAKSDEIYITSSESPTNAPYRVENIPTNLGDIIKVLPFQGTLMVIFERGYCTFAPSYSSGGILQFTTPTNIKETPTIINGDSIVSDSTYVDILTIEGVKRVWSYQTSVTQVPQLTENNLSKVINNVLLKDLENSKDQKLFSLNGRTYVNLIIDEKDDSGDVVQVNKLYIYDNGKDLISAQSQKWYTWEGPAFNIRDIKSYKDIDGNVVTYILDKESTNVYQLGFEYIINSSDSTKSSTISGHVDKAIVTTRNFDKNGLQWKEDVVIGIPIKSTFVTNPLGSENIYDSKWKNYILSLNTYGLKQTYYRKHYALDTTTGQFVDQNVQKDVYEVVEFDGIDKFGSITVRHNGTKELDSYDIGTNNILNYGMTADDSILYTVLNSNIEELTVEDKVQLGSAKAWQFKIKIVHDDKYPFTFKNIRTILKLKKHR